VQDRPAPRSQSRSLPARPDLGRLRDEAKRRQRSGEFPTLALAQVALAREHGFASWPRLKFHVEALTLGAGERARLLVRSACSSDLRRARALLAADPALARHDLACACVTGEAADVVCRLERSPQLARRVAAPFGWQPILYACFSRLLRDGDRAPGIRAVVAALLDAGADPNASFDHDGWLQVPLYGAAGIANDAAITRLLIGAGADPNDAREPTGVGEALYHAVEFADPTCAALLIDAGTNSHVVAHCLGRALNFAAPAMAEMICARGARASSAHLHQAVFKRRPLTTVRALLDAGAPVGERDDEGLTPLQVATRWGDHEIAALLAERGADQASVSDEDRALGAFLAGSGSPPAHATGLDELLDQAVHAGDLDAVRRLLRAGARVDGDPNREHTPLAQAAWRGHADVVAELVAAGASLRWGEGSAIGAALHGSRHCHDPEGGPTMRTIEEIPRERYARAVQVLLDAGAPVPEEMAGRRSRPTVLIAELGLDPPGPAPR
jgi:ankyrin repeat protein